MPESLFLIKNVDFSFLLISVANTSILNIYASSELNYFELAVLRSMFMPSASFNLKFNLKFMKEEETYNTNMARGPIIVSATLKEGSKVIKPP